MAWLRFRLPKAIRAGMSSPPRAVASQGGVSVGGKTMEGTVLQKGRGRWGRYPTFAFDRGRKRGMTSLRTRRPT